MIKVRSKKEREAYFEGFQAGIKFMVDRHPSVQNETSARVGRLIVEAGNYDRNPVQKGYKKRA